MLFSSLTFLLLFLPLVWIISRLLSVFQNLAVVNVFLLFSSLLFYAWGEPYYVLLMVFSILWNWMFGVLMERFPSRSGILMTLGIFTDVSLLIYFKYFGLLMDVLSRTLGLNLSLTVPALPIGISFFTFQAMSYLIDVKRKKCDAQKNVLKLALYISFFPQLIAGPIVKYKDISAQIDSRKMTHSMTMDGCRRFAYGLGKKVLIANAMGEIADKIYATDIAVIGRGILWLAAIAYTFQIYYDFSGYSDMAIGLGKIFGFSFRENFHYPYLASSVRDFWRRWHISLSSWFRDYVYIPLGGSKTGNAKTYVNLFVVFLLTGIWHGANYTFLVWGLFHGCFLMMERFLEGRGIHIQGTQGLFRRILKSIYTMLVVIVGWVFFRSDSLVQAGSIISRMFLLSGDTSLYSVREFIDHRGITMLCFAFFGAGIIPVLFDRHQVAQKWKGSVAEIIFLIAVTCFSVLGIVGSTYNPFLYFRF